MSNYFDFTEATLNALRGAGLAMLETVTICSQCKLAFIDGIEGGPNDELCDECHAKERN